MNAITTVRLALRQFVSGTIISRVMGMTREMVTAALFGTQAELAAFFVAFRFVNLPRRLLGEGAMQSALVPLYEKLRLEDEARGERLIWAVMWAITSLTLALVFAAQLGRFVGGEVGSFFALLSPALVFICLYGLGSSYLQCHGRYFVPSVAPALFNLVWIASAWYGRSIHALVLGVVIAFAVQAVLLWPWIWPRLRSSFTYRSTDLKQLWKPLGLAILGVGAIQLNSALDALFARWADPHGPAYLWYALRLQQLPLGLFGVGMMGAALPSLSRLVASKDAESLRETLDFVWRRALVIMLFFTFGILAAGEDVVSLLYGRGAFTMQDGQDTTLCLFAYGLALLPMAIVIIGSALFHAYRDYKTPAICALIAVVVNVILNCVVVFQLKLGAISIAFTTATSSYLHASLITVWIAWKGLDGPLRHWRILGGSALAGFIALWFLALTLGSWHHGASRSLQVQLTNVIVMGGGYSLFFGAVMWCGLESRRLWGR